MRTKIRSMAFAAVLLGFAGAITLTARNAWQEPAAKQASSTLSDEERGQLMAKGKAIFVEKCAKCHNERGDKPLSSGQPLSERGLGTDVIAGLVNGRLKGRPEEDRRAVTLYISSLMKDADKSAPKP